MESQEEKIKKLKKPLSIEDIDFRIQSISKNGWATILAYKNARVDMNRLDDAFGCLNWKREHTRDNHNCIISVWDEEKKQWISKEDTGTESYSDKEKGLASDSFKRAGFNWGIGRELYDYPLILVQLNQNEFKVEGNKAKATYNLKLKNWTWKSEFKDNEIISLSAVDNNNTSRFQWSKNKVQRTMQNTKPLLQIYADATKKELTQEMNSVYLKMKSGEYTSIDQIKQLYAIDKVSEATIQSWFIKLKKSA